MASFFLAWLGGPEALASLAKYLRDRVECVRWDGEVLVVRVKTRSLEATVAIRPERDEKGVVGKLASAAGCSE